MLIDDPLTGLLIYFVSLTAGFGQIFRRGFVAVAEQNHRLVKWIGTFVKFVGRDADNLALFKLMGFVAPLHDAFAGEHIISSVRRMIMHYLYFPRRKEENPGVEVFTAKNILAPLAWLTVLGHFHNVHDFHETSLSIDVSVRILENLVPLSDRCQGGMTANRALLYRFLHPLRRRPANTFSAVIGRSV